MSGSSAPLRLTMLSVALTFFVGVFLPSAPVLAEEKRDDGTGFYVGFDQTVGNNERNGGGGSSSTGDDDGDADPDWFQTSVWTQADMTKVEGPRVEVPRTLSVVPAIGPFGYLVNWLLEHVDIEYITVWR